jgi:hypothetical protein
LIARVMIHRPRRSARDAEMGLVEYIREHWMKSKPTTIEKDLCKNLRERWMKSQERMEYRERYRIQTLLWAMGKPTHNRIDNECCPDFSCCHPELFTEDRDKRWQTYHNEHGQKN